MDEGDSLSLSYQEPSLPQLEVVNEERSSDNVFEPMVSTGHVSALSLGEDKTPPVHMEENHRSNGEKPTRHHCHHLSSSSFLQRQLSTDELQLKRASPYYMLEEEAPVCELWVASSNARHSTITVVDYAQQFTRLEVGHAPPIPEGPWHVCDDVVAGCGGRGFPCAVSMCGPQEGVAWDGGGLSSGVRCQHSQTIPAGTWGRGCM